MNLQGPYSIEKLLEDMARDSLHRREAQYTVILDISQSQNGLSSHFSSYNFSFESVPGLHVVEETKVVELDLAQVQEVPAQLWARCSVEVHRDGPDRRLDDDRHDVCFTH